MSRYLIAYIDEDQGDREQFEIYFDEYKEDFQVTNLFPGKKSLEELVEEVVETAPDIVVLDFNLKYSDDTVPDNGDVVMQRISDRKPLLPVVLMTSYKNFAEKSFISPEKRKSILEKSMLNDAKDKGFRDELLVYITYYKDLLQKYKDEFAGLQHKGQLSDVEQARLLELDSILEEAVDRQSAIKSEHKTDENLSDLQNLISSTKELIKDLKNKPNASV
ncbi:response regulator [Taibaiella soli]|uniref:Response regulatory domain-containing protein n=1 Tax=Taibaiella soli TaxID=1649169 RepID=A0A2W2AB31_9BACT|nr:response regulator [Taibaiella soli]PZF72615.1 hypothetical protein DN068_12170 [Taibaiella soli]